jgi:hypothetical protein
MYKASCLLICLFCASTVQSSPILTLTLPSLFERRVRMYSEWYEWRCADRGRRVHTTRFVQRQCVPHTPVLLRQWRCGVQVSRYAPEPRVPRGCLPSLRNMCVLVAPLMWYCFSYHNYHDNVLSFFSLLTLSTTLLHQLICTSRDRFLRGRLSSRV